MNTVIYKTLEQLSCACNSSVIICLSPSLTKLGAPFINGALLSVTTTLNACQQPVFNNSIEYDPNDLLDSSYSLLNSDIIGVVCRDCLTDYIDYEVSSGTPALLETCFVYSEAELLLAEAGACKLIVVAGSFSLTADRTITKSITYLENSVTLTAGFKFILTGHFTAGTYKCFDTVNTVKFAAGVTEQVLPQWFGAIGSGAVDDSGAFNAALASLKYVISVNRYTPTAKLFVPSGQYLISSSLDCTAFHGLVIEGNGMESILVLSTSGTVGLDFTHSERSFVKHLYLQSGDGALASIVMVLLARNSTNASAGWHRFEDVQLEGAVSGTTQKAVLYSYSSEVNEFYSCRLYVRNESGYGLYVTSTNALAVASPFQTIANSEQSNTTTRWLGGHLVDNGTHVAPVSSIPVFLGNARDVTIDGAWLAAGGLCHIYLLSDGANSLDDEINIINCRFEYGGHTPQYTIYGDAANTSTVIGCIQGNMLAAGTAFIKQATGNGAFYFGQVSGNNWAGNAPTYFMDIGNDVVGGFVDALRLPVRVKNAYGLTVVELNRISEFTVTSGNPGSSINLLTSGVTEEKAKLNAELTMYSDGIILPKSGGNIQYPATNIINGGIAAGNSQGTAYVLDNSAVYCLYSDLNTKGWVLPTVAAVGGIGVTKMIVIFTAAGGKLYPASGETINQLAANTPIDLPANSTHFCIVVNTHDWLCG